LNVALILSLVAARASAQNLVVNGDFETGALAPWQWFGLGTNTLSFSPDTPTGSGVSADLDINEVLGLPWLVQDVPIQPGVTYAFTASVREVEPFRPDVDGWIAAQVWMLSDSESGAILASNFTIFTDPAWETKSFTITAPETAGIARVLFTPQDPDFGVGTGQYRVDDVMLTAAPMGVPGDFNVDSFVNDVDFNIWSTGFGTASGAQLQDGDADGDEDVDGADFMIWQANFGTAPLAATIPEPSSSALAILLLGVASWKGRRAGSSSDV